MLVSLISHPEVSSGNHTMLIDSLNKKGVEYEVLLPYNFSSVIDASSTHYYYKDTKWSPTHVIHRSIAPFLEFMEPMLGELEARNCSILNPIAQALISRNKFYAASLLSKAGIKVVPSLATYCDNDKLPNYPVKILKPSDGCKGFGVEFKEERSAILQELEQREKGKLQILQPYFGEFGSDFRAYVVNGSTVAVAKRSATTGDFRANLALGAQAVPLGLEHPAAAYAARAANVLGLEACGVDMVYHENDYYVLEANAWAGFVGLAKACEVDIAGKIIDFLLTK